MQNRARVQEAMEAMSHGRVGRLLALMADDVTWRWMGVGQWSRTFEGKQAVADNLFGGATDELGPSSSVDVSHIHADGDSVLVEHVGHNVLPDGRNYDNQYCWVLRFEGDLIHEVREYMDTLLVTETFGADEGAHGCVTDPEVLLDGRQGGPALAGDDRHPTASLRARGAAVGTS